MTAKAEQDNDTTRACEGFGDFPDTHCGGSCLGRERRTVLCGRRRADTLHVIGLRDRRWFVEKLDMGERASAFAEVRVAAPLSGALTRVEGDTPRVA